jgi:hypothetical protein
MAGTAAVTMEAVAAVIADRSVVQAAQEAPLFIGHN